MHLCKVRKARKVDRPSVARRPASTPTAAPARERVNIHLELVHGREVRRNHHARARARHELVRVRAKLLLDLIAPLCKVGIEVGGMALVVRLQEVVAVPEAGDRMRAVLGAPLESRSVVSAGEKSEDDEAATGESYVRMALEFFGGVDIDVVLACLAISVQGGIGLVPGEVDARAVPDMSSSAKSRETRRSLLLQDHARAEDERVDVVSNDSVDRSALVEVCKLGFCLPKSL